jgi:hypothetical protein
VTDEILSAMSNDDAVWTCQVMFGSLLINGVSTERHSQLRMLFSQLQEIHGDLIVTSNDGILMLDIFSQLRQVLGTISIESNSNLVDARIPSLVHAASVVASDNHALCEAYLPLSDMPVTDACGRYAVAKYASITFVTSATANLHHLASQMRVALDGYCTNCNATVDVVPPATLIHQPDHLLVVYVDSPDSFETADAVFAQVVALDSVQSLFRSYGFTLEWFGSARVQVQTVVWTGEVLLSGKDDGCSADIRNRIHCFDVTSFVHVCSIVVNLKLLQSCCVLM